MNRITSSRDTLRQTLHNQLQPGEQLLWSDYPLLKKLRFPLTPKVKIFLTPRERIFFTSKEGIFDRCVNGILAFVITAFIFASPGPKVQVPFWIYAVIFFFLFFMFALQSLLETKVTNPLEQTPGYRRYTLYAITNHRVIIAIRLPGSPTIILSYFPCDIDLSPGLIRPDGSGVLPFGKPRAYRIGRYGGERIFPGRFWGISRVHEVTALLEEVKSKSESLA